MLHPFVLLWLAVTLCFPVGSRAQDSANEIASFAWADGFLPIDTDYFWSEQWNGEHRFPNYDRSSIFHADVSVYDAEKAIIAIDALDGPLPHVRYRISSRDLPREEDWMMPFRLVEVTRFDLAPTLVASIAEAYEGIFTPVTPEPAPHVTWRFVFTTDKFMGAGPVVVGRRILTEQEAAEAMCFALPCLALTDPLGDGWQWDDISVDETIDPPAYPDTDSSGMTVPARVADLLHAAGDVRRDYEMVISARVVGQDDTVNGIIRYNRFTSDEVSSDWIVRRQVASLPPFWGWTRTSRTAGEPDWTLPDGFDAGDTVWTHVPVEQVPAWRMTIAFDSGTDAPLIYGVHMNAGVATYLSDHWLYIGLDTVGGQVFARDGQVALPILPYGQYLHEFMHWHDVPTRITATGESRQFGEHVAQEYRLIYNQPDVDGRRYLAWTGRFWAINALPAAMGWYGLPGSAFAGRSERFRLLWGGLSRDLAEYGLIVEADITLVTDVTQDALRAVLEERAGPASLIAQGSGHQRVIMQVTDLMSNGGYDLAVQFPDLAPFGTATWPFALPAQPVPILDLQ
ncbi:MULTISPECIES: hypothetical protein [unclassified Yoonia]|uniref:hypothetical protein n=1 Tax=unclassified Yoonia TaxID=2629118 RepID=UPI002AFE068F|nr:MULTISPECIES: hypothetical protein [unclassified Yoonia]